MDTTEAERLIANARGVRVIVDPEDAPAVPAAAADDPAALMAEIEADLTAQGHTTYIARRRAKHAIDASPSSPTCHNRDVSGLVELVATLAS